MSSTMSPREFLRTPGLHWPSRIFRLRKIGRPASCKVESCRVKIQSCLVLIRPIVNDFFFFRPPFFAEAPAWPFLGLLGDLGDEESLLANELLRFLLSRSIDRILDFPPRMVHRLVLEGWHYLVPGRQWSVSVLGSRSVVSWSVVSWSRRSVLVGRAVLCLVPIAFRYAFNRGASSSKILLRLSTVSSFRSFLRYARRSQCFVSLSDPRATRINRRLSWYDPRPAPSAIFAPMLSAARMNLLPHRSRASGPHSSTTSQIPSANFSDKR